MIVDQVTFFKIQSKFNNVPYNQTQEWLLSNYYEQLEQVVYFVDDLNSPNMCCWGIVFNRKFIGKHLIIDGDTLKNEISPLEIKLFYEKIINFGYTLIDLSSIDFYNANYEIGVRRAGFKRPLGFTLSALTLLLNVQESFNFHRNWRRNVKKSKDSQNYFKHISSPTENDMMSFINLFNELKQRKGLGYILKIENLKTLLNSSKFKLFFAFNNDGIPLAGRIVYIENDNSYDLYAANSGNALKSGAVYFLQEEIFNFLKNIGIVYFDYGRIPPGTDEMDSIYVSKSYSNAKPISYNGQWQYSKFKLLTIIVCFKNFYLNKLKQY